MKRIWRLIYPYLVLSAFMAVLGFVYQYHFPRFKLWLIVQIEEQTREHLPMRVFPSDISFQLFPLSISLHRLRVLPKPDLEKTLQHASLKELRIELNVWQLLSGRLRLQEITLVRPAVNLNIKRFSKSSEPISVDQLIHFDRTLGVPLDRITVLEADVRVALAEPELIIHGTRFSASLYRGRQAVALQVIAPYLLVQNQDDPSDLSFAARGGMRLTPTALEFSDLHLKKGKSIVRLNGTIDGDITQIKWAQFSRPVEARLQSLLDLGELSHWAQRTFPQYKIPEASGQLRTDLEVLQRNRGTLKVSGQIQGRDLGAKGFRIGSVDAEGSYRNRELTLTTARIENNAGRLDLKSSSVRFDEKVSFQTRLETEGVQLHAALQNLKVGDLPLELKIKAQIPCTGTLRPTPEISCQGSLHGQDLHIWSDHARKHTIVAALPLSAQGEVKIDSKKVQYKAKLQADYGHGESSGKIEYDSGFQISYNGDRLDLRGIKSLANLKLEGKLKVEGTTEGDSHAATLQMKVNGENVWFEDYLLGTAAADISYRAGALEFRDLRGTIGTSHYTGNVSFNFPQNRLFVAGQSTKLSAQDVTNALSRKVQLPMSVFGQGQAQVRVSGPPRFNALTYSLRTSLTRGTVAGESFERAVFNVSAKDGEVEADEVFVAKGNGLITLTGRGHPDGNIEAHIKGRNLQLEDSEFLASLSSTLSGRAEFDMKLSDHVLLPDATLTGQVHDMDIAETPMGDSRFALRFTRHTLEGQAQLLADRIKTRFIYPYDESAPFKLYFITKDLDFAPLVLGLVDSNQARSEFQSQLTAEVDLEAAQGGFWNASGDAKISKLMFKRGGLQLANRLPAVIRMTGGQMNLDRLILEGDDAFIRIHSNTPSRKKMDFNVQAKTDLAFAQILTPFLGDLRGPLTASTQVRGDETGLDVLGSAFFENAVIKIRQFPHAFTNLKADILFNQRKIIFNSISGELGGGQLTGEGDLEVRGYKNFPLRLNTHISGMELNVPEGVRTRGDADLQLTGTWFPYLLRGNYSVHSGLMSREFTDGGSSETLLRQSSYLPKTVTADVFNPLNLHIDVDIGNYQVRNSMADTAISGQLIVTGSVQNPNLKGEIYPQRGGRVLFREQTEFDITGGKVTFVEGRTNDPKLFLTATTRVQSFDINLLLQGTAQKPDIKLSSQPAMSQPEIISLLALGVLPPQYQTDPTRNESREAVQSGTKIGTALLGDSPIKKEIKDKTGFNVDISSANPNKTPTFAPIDDTVSVPKITVSRQWTPKFGASASRTVGDVQLSDVKFKYQLNRSLSLVGRWETREVDPASVQTSQTLQNAGGLDSSSLFGLDLEYKLEFK